MAGLWGCQQQCCLGTGATAWSMGSSTVFLSESALQSRISFRAPNGWIIIPPPTEELGGLARAG